MSTSPTRVFAARLAGLPVFDPAGDQVGKVRDLVAVLRPSGLPPRVLGLVVEVFGRRSIFVPMTRVTSIDSGQVITTGLVNMRRFEQRPTETLVFGEMLDRTVTRPRSTGVEGTVYDVAMEQARTRDWVISRVALQEGSKRFGRKGQTHVVEWREVEGFDAPEETQGATHLLAALEEMRPADLANVHPRPAGQAPRRDRRRPRRRAARRRPRGAARGGPGRDPRQARQRARRRRPRGDVARRRRRPDRRAAARRPPRRCSS